MGGSEHEGEVGGFEWIREGVDGQIDGGGRGLVAFEREEMERW